MVGRGPSSKVGTGSSSYTLLNPGWPLVRPRGDIRENLIKQAQLRFQRIFLVDLWETNMILKVGKKSNIVQFYVLETTVQEG